MANKPRIRFKGFTEDWEQRKLTDIAKTFIGLVTTMTENYRDSGTLLIRNSDIKEGQFIFSEKPIHLDEEFAEKNKTRRLQIGDVVTVHTGDIGTSAVIKEKEAGAIGFATINTRTDKRLLNPYFLSTYFNTKKHKCYANSVSTGDGRSNYNIKDFNKLVISIPTLDEQEKISALINNINTIITLHQCKLEKLKLTKKTLLQKLFPKNGKHIPEIRFKGFTDAWEQRKLGDLIFLNGRIGFRGYTEADIVSKDEGGVLTFSPTNIVDNQITIKCKNTYITRLKYDESPEIKIYNGDILFVKTGSTLGKSALVKDVFEDATLNPQVVVMRPNNLDSKFLSVMMLTDNIASQVRKSRIGGAVPTLTESNIKSFDTLIPKNDEEAQKIGKIFGSLDHVITLHQRKLERLQEVKKGLLQKMFV